jgi:hypothetical protein
MPRLPSPIGGSIDAIVELLRQWKSTIDAHLPKGAGPVLVPRNCRCEKPATNTIRLRWDPAGLGAEGHDVSYSEHPNFASSQAHRVYGRGALYFDLVVQDTKRRYFRVRAFQGGKTSRWSNIAACIADISVPSGVVSGLPGTITYTPTTGPYGMMGFKTFVLTGKADLLHVVMWYVDESAIQYLWGVLTASLDATTTPVSVGATVFSRPVAGVNPVFAVGDLLLINDPDQDAVNTAFRSYEVAEIDTITGAQPGAITLGLKNRGSLESFKSAHNAGRRFYKIKAAHFAVPTKDNAGNDKIISEEYFPLPSGCVVAMAIAASDVGFIGTYNRKNCSKLAYPFPGSLIERNPAPGFRTCTGAEYALGLVGQLGLGQTMPVRIVVSENSAIRQALGILAVPATGSTAVYDGILGNIADVALVAYILYIEPLQINQANAARRVAVVEQLAFKSGEAASFPSTDLPDFRRMPYTLTWPFELPVVGTIASLFDPDLGSLMANALPFTASGEFVSLEEAGQLDAVIARPGSSVLGSALDISLMT